MCLNMAFVCFKTLKLQMMKSRSLSVTHEIRFWLNYKLALHVYQYSLIRNPILFLFAIFYVSLPIGFYIVVSIKMEDQKLNLNFFDWIC